MRHSYLVLVATKKATTEYFAIKGERGAVVPGDEQSISIPQVYFKIGVDFFEQRDEIARIKAVPGAQGMVE